MAARSISDSCAREKTEAKKIHAQGSSHSRPTLQLRSRIATASQNPALGEANQQHLRARETNRQPTCWAGRSLNERHATRSRQLKRAHGERLRRKSRRPSRLRSRPQIPPPSPPPSPRRIRLRSQQRSAHADLAKSRCLGGLLGQLSPPLVAHLLFHPVDETDHLRRHHAW